MRRFLVFLIILAVISSTALMSGATAPGNAFALEQEQPEAVEDAGSLESPAPGRGNSSVVDEAEEPEATEGSTCVECATPALGDSTGAERAEPEAAETSITPVSEAPIQGKPTELEKKELSVIEEAVKQKGARWTTGETPISRLSPEERKRLVGTSAEPEATGRLRVAASKVAGESVGLPASFDWRNYNGGNWMTSVKNQGSCGSCWAFGSLAAFEAGIRIGANDYDLPINLSEQFLVSCSDGSCGGWYISSTMNYLENTGAVDETCFAYQGRDTIPCSSRCSDWQSRIEKIEDWGWVGGGWGPASVTTIKQALLQGPLPTYMVVYTDFFYYHGGVYEHTWGSLEGGHLVTLVGWNDSGGYWICKNSWNTGWGESGYFKIKMGVNEVSIEEGTAWMEISSSPPPPPPPPPATFAIENGQANISHEWTTVSLSQSFTNPVVVAKQLSWNDGNPGVVRIKDVTSSSFKIMVQEWDYLDGGHSNETVGWMVMEKGHFTEASHIEAGTINTSSITSFTAVSFSQAFSKTPVVITSVMTYNGSDTVATRNYNITKTGFNVKMQEQEDNDGSHTTETISYIAWEPGTHELGGKSYVVDTQSNVNHGWSTISYGSFDSPPIFLADMQTASGGDTANLRRCNHMAGSVDVKVDEEQSYDTETWHADEVVGYFALGSASTPPPPPAFRIETGEVAISHEWTAVNFSQSFTNPVVVAKQLSYSGGDPGVVRIKDVTSNSFKIMVQEWDYLDGPHTTETVGWMVMERGHFTGAGHIEAGTINTSSITSFTAVSFSQAFSKTPVVITSVMTYSGGDTVATRNMSITKTGFKVMMKEQEDNDGAHTTETISYIAWEPGSGTVDGKSYVVDTQSNVNHGWSTVSYGSFDRPPIFLADMQTTNGGDTANLRRCNHMAGSVDVKVDEEQSYDTETWHTDEVVGYFCVQNLAGLPGGDHAVSQVAHEDPVAVMGNTSVLVTTASCMDEAEEQARDEGVDREQDESSEAGVTKKSDGSKEEMKERFSKLKESSDEKEEMEERFSRLKESQEKE